jgi:hypothetical protein
MDPAIPLLLSVEWDLYCHFFSLLVGGDGSPTPLTDSLRLIV